MGESIVVIGGNAAGMTAASRAKRLDPNLEITLLEASPFISYSICGLPYYVSGMVGEHERLISFSPERLRTERGILSRTNVRVDEIYTGRSLVACTDLRSEKSFEIPYRKIVIATGYVPRVPDIDGLRLQNVFTVSRLEDGIRIRNAIERNKLRRAVIVGGGYIGLMMAHALRTLGLEVLLVERNPHVFNQVDEEIAELIQEELRRNQIDLVLETRVRKLAGLNGAVQAVEVGPEVRPVGLAVIDVGIDPNTALAERSGIPCGMSGAIWVDERGQTRTGGVYAAGNCAQTVSQVSGQPIFSSLGTTAAKQGRVVGENLAGQTSIFRGSLETSLEKVFQLAVARTGLTLRQAYKAGFAASSVYVTDRNRARYYPDAGPMHVKLIFDRGDGRILGGQIAGNDSVAKRIDTLVAALTARMTVWELSQLDLAYAPPYGTLWDPLQIAANLALRQL